MQLFYDPDAAPPRHTLGEEESKHCVRVLRLGRGDTLHLTDGRGNLYRCCITDDDPKHCTVRIDDVQSRFGKLPYSLTMAVAPTKNTERFEWFLEKATEVGIDAIVPLGTEHSERRIFRTERGGKVITAAMKQSLKAYRPELRELTPFREEVLRPFPGQRFIAHCGAAHAPEGKAYLPQAVQAGTPVEIFIGPEGDFSPAEIDFALAHGFREITLGDQRLRTETAALTAVVMASVANGPKQTN